MDILIRDSTTNEILHTVSIEAGDDRRDDVVKAVLDQFPPDSVYVDDEPSAALTGDAHDRGLEDGAAAVDSLSPIGAAGPDDEETPADVEGETT